MRFTTPFIAAALMAAATLLAAPAASAQQAASVVVLDYQRVIATSDVGRDMTTRLGQIQQQMQSELQPEAEAIERERQSLAQAMSGLTPEQMRADPRVAQMQQRLEQFRERQVTAARDLDYTRQATLLDFNRQITPIVQEVVQSYGAGVALDTAAVQLVLPGADVTERVVERLNQRLRTINVSRQSAPPPQQQQ